MGSYVVVSNYENLDRALIDLRKRVRNEYGRPWYKRRYGFYEKPSELKRKRKKMGRRRGGSSCFFHPGSLKLHIEQKEIFARTGPTTSVQK
ncbi:hypothetical protein CCAX7_29450 [Capsulimonas corticalis]|uniref:Uncharacterized protein n=1 Tax=Capsulimonas corticalis TaxID=2219043 RepID=A0A402CT09_9BACT|nr:30S ribosomal protein S21 [Capsulimonas corticalis]BDI30894.1 hypothetical protein CCAX7_29450 [Capsulimonas corticalis]